MKKVFIIITALLLFISIFAHPPMKIHAYFDTEISKIYVEITHKVKNAQKHYIQTIKVYRNDKEIVNQAFDMQFDENTQKAEYLIPGMNTQDTFKIFAQCNLGGKDTEVFLIDEEEE